MFELEPEPAADRRDRAALRRWRSAAGSHAAYPTPALQPAGGFTIDKSLVYAIVWQESRFNSLAVSPVGAVGLMQLMPTVGRQRRRRSDPAVRADPPSSTPARTCELGQAYIRWLENNAGHYDLLRTIAAYNGGPTTLARTEALLGPDADSLLVIESVPFAETRAYVKKVVAAYWTYRRQFGAPTRTLDAVASGHARIDVRLDSPAPASAPASVQNAQSCDRGAPGAGDPAPPRRLTARARFGASQPSGRRSVKPRCARSRAGSRRLAAQVRGDELHPVRRELRRQRHARDPGPLARSNAAAEGRRRDPRRRRRRSPARRPPRRSPPPRAPAPRPPPARARSEPRQRLGRRPTR